MRAWILNLDAELELASIGPYARPDAMKLIVARNRDRARAAVCAPGDVVIGVDEVPEGAEARAWCPTPTALEAIEAAGLELPKAPPAETLRRVAHRGFHARLPGGLPEGAFIEDVRELEAKLKSPGPTGSWRLKRPYGVAGRWQRVVTGGALVDDDRTWIRGALRRGGVLVEPQVEVGAEFTFHGWIAPNDGPIVYGKPCSQICDERGEWIETRRAEDDELSPDELSALEEEAEHTAWALQDSGYFGPFGIDAMRGSLGFIARNEINPRYAMGWRVGGCTEGTP